MAELLPRLAALAALARRYDIGLNIDAEEADRLELSLDLLEALCFDPALGGWNGIGFVVQAYRKRCAAVIDWLIDLARRSGRRIMVRLVKGAYWDSEIKRAQVDGLDGFPVFTRKVHTDVSYLACARKLLAAPDAVFPQFATHNAHTLAADHAPWPAPISTPASTNSSACTAWASRSTRRSSARDEARPPVPHLRAGRHARDAARLSGAPAAGERRQHLLRQPHRRCDGAGRRRWSPTRSRAARAIEPLGAPHPTIAAAARPLRRRRGAIRAGLDLSERAAPRLARRGSARQRSRRPLARRSAAGAARRRPRAQPVLNPADRRDVVGTVVEAHARRRSTRRSPRPTPPRRLGRRRRPRSAPPCLRRAADLHGSAACRRCSA